MRLQNKEVLLAWPLALHVLTAGYYYSDGSLHRAIDLRTNQNGNTEKPVYAAEDGTVDQIQSWDGRTTTGMQSYGNMIRLCHADYRDKPLQTRYAHLSRICVQQGQQVREGDLIGYTGATGNVSGAHLHFEVIWDGSRRNPLVWLDDDFTTADGGVYTYGAGEGPVPRENAASALQTLCIGPASAGDVARLQALATELSLPCEVCG